MDYILDPLNAAETAIVKSLKHAQGGEGWPDGLLADVATIHEKIRRDGEGSPEYYDHELPAVGVYCQGNPEEDTETLIESEIEAHVTFDVVVAGGDSIQSDRVVKRIIGHIEHTLRWLSLHPNDDGPGGIMTLSCSGITVGPNRVEPLFTGEVSWISEGATQARIELTIDPEDV